MGFITVLLLALNFASTAHADSAVPFIAFDDEVSIKAPLLDDVGDNVRVIPVHLHQTDAQTVEVQQIAVAPLPDYEISSVPSLPAHSSATFYPVVSIRLGVPQIISGSLGVIIGKIDYNQGPYDGKVIASGVLLQLEPGLGGAKASVGLAHLRSFNLPRGHISLPELMSVGGVAVKASVLQTWGYPIKFALDNAQASSPFSSLPTGATFVGPEIDFSFVVKISLGVLFGVSENVRGQSILALSLGWGF